MIERVRRETFAHFAPAHYSAEEVDNLLENFDAAEALAMIENGSLFVAETGSVIVACAGWHREHIRHVYVKPAMTGMGIGSTVLSHAENDFQKRTSVPTIQANVILYAAGFYRRSGYSVISEERAWDGSAYYRMSKELGSPSGL
ncbi:GNAT family N-acetyltransferase [Chelativorans sp. YIM 93263]|uniref:GNAT family N-acetyltransferase n=1 Tax=Chelativorans sp. YIM 93263 TaxID=2906648 RepID=UPI00237865BC|nr:GNAT family N-acetyltransferase [Chelativorans sp. YIM 93263]